MIKGILWDNDGLLVDSERVYFEANRQVLLRAGIRLTKEIFADVSMRQGLGLMDLAAQKGWTVRQIKELREERDAYYLTLLRQGVKLFPGVGKTLKTLHAAGVRMGIVTSSQRIHFDAIHEKSRLLSYFEFVLTREDFVHGKPAPDGYREGLRRLGLPANVCLAVEDSERGLVAARAANLECVVVPNEHSAGGDFSNALAILPRVSDLLPLVK